MKSFSKLIETKFYDSFLLNVSNIKYNEKMLQTHKMWH